MKIKPTITPISKMTMKYLWVKTIDLKPLEFHEGSIVTQGFILEENLKPTHIVFRARHNKRKVKVIDALITPEIAIFYTDKDTRDWPYTKRCKFYCDRQIIYIGDGIMVQIKNL